MDEFALCWNNFADNIASGFQNLYDRGDLVDVTIACDGKLLKAHKIVLAICSPYFQEMFMTNPCKHPIIVLKDVSVNVMQELLQFMYQGEVNVKHSELQCFMKIAETLQIKGLTASHKNDRSPTPSAQPAPAHLNSNRASTSQLDPSKLNSYLAAAAKESLKRAADGVSADQYPIHYPKKAIKRSTDSMEQDSNSDCMDNLSSDEAFIPASPQVSMVEQSSSAARQFDLSNVKREVANDSLSSPQQSPTNLATSAAAMGAAAAAAAAGMKLGFSSTPTHPSTAAAALHPMFGGFDHNSTTFSGIATSLASLSGNGASGVGAGAAPGSTGSSASGMKMGGSMDYPSDYGSDYGKGAMLPGHMDIPAGSGITMLSSTSLLHNNCIFNRNNTVATQQGLKTYWLCKSYRVSMCRARCITHHGQVISSTGVHNHPPHMKGPHEFAHQPQPQPPPPPPPPNLGQNPQHIPQSHHPQEHHSNIPPVGPNNGTYQDFHHNSHYQPTSNVMMGPPPLNHDPNQYPTHQHHHQLHSHPQQPPYPEMPPHHPHSYPPHYATNAPPNMPPQPPMVHQPAPPPPPQLPPQNATALSEPPEAPDIKLIQLQPATVPTTTAAVDEPTNSSIAGGDNIPMQVPQAAVAPATASDGAADHDVYPSQHLQLKIEQLS